MSLRIRSVRLLASAGLLAAVACLSTCGPADNTQAGDPAVGADAQEGRGMAGEATVLQAGAERDAVVQAAQPVAGALMQTLSSNLVAAMEAEGPVGAMEFCNVEALPLTRQVTEEQGMEVFRTSLQLRNPLNAPDESASRALAWYRERIASDGEIPASHVQKLPDGSYRYYQALQVGEACLRCHGAPEQLAPGVPEALADLYPEDQATGYTQGAWRGLLGITVPASAGDGAE